MQSDKELKEGTRRWNWKVWFAIVWLGLAFVLMIVLIIATINQTPTR